MGPGNNGRIYALYPNGTEKWHYDTGYWIVSDPAIGDDGTVYIGSGDSYLYALWPDGTLRWRFKTGDYIKGPPSIADDGTIYVGSWDNYLYALWPNGTMRWKCGIGQGTETNPSIASDWVESSPAIAEDGTVYIGSSNEGGGYLHAFGSVESNEPPGTPTISGETNGWAGRSYWYTFKSIDPDRNPISFYIDWGDGNEGWTTYEHASGENCYYEHAWSEWDEYTIRCKAKDVMGEESDWAELTVSMPRNRATYNLLFLRFLEQFPILQKMLFLIK
jgi:outer membrane protein assembly factor BamB